MAASWLATAAFSHPDLKAHSRFGVLERMGSSYGRSSRGIVLRFIVSATGWEAMKWKTMARVLPAPAPDSVDLLSGSERTPSFW